MAAAKKSKVNEAGNYTKPVCVLLCLRKLRLALRAETLENGQHERLNSLPLNTRKQGEGTRTNGSC